MKVGKAVLLVQSISIPQGETLDDVVCSLVQVQDAGGGATTALSAARFLGKDGLFHLRTSDLTQWKIDGTALAVADRLTLSLVLDEVA